MYYTPGSCQVLTVYTDHRLVRTTIRLTHKPAVKKRVPQTKKLHVQQLLAKEDVFKKELDVKLSNEELSGQE